jgi:hypothetical protein
MQTKYIKILQYAMIKCSSALLFGSLTRIADLQTRPFTIEQTPRSIWASGDYIVGRYVGQEDEEANLELIDGSLQPLKFNDLVVGALGDRQATYEVVGTWKLIDEASHPITMDMICGSGVYGVETSRCSKHPPSPKFIYEGHCLRLGKKICMKDFRPKQNTREMPQCKIILLAGSSMSSGKTFTGRAIIDMIKNQLGIQKVAAVKFTGAGYSHDIRQFSEAGADFVCDFVDAGYPSTVMSAEEYRETALPAMLTLLAEQNADVIVGEVGASPLEKYNGVEVLKKLLISDSVTRPENVYLILCASDAYGILGLKKALVNEGLTTTEEILGVSGMAACNTAAAELVKRVSGLDAFNLKNPDSVDDLRVLLEKCLLSGCH